MNRHDLDHLFDETLRHRRLLTHPFYRRWEAGELAPSELGAYAGQYRHFEAAVVDVLSEVEGALDDDTARRLVQGNLNDERGVPAPHLALFDEFLAAVDGDADAAATPATTRLVGLYRQLAGDDPVAALAALAAYEVQAPGVAVSKADGLVRHYGLSVEATRFWDVHGVMDEDHAAWTIDALAALDCDEQTVRSAAGAAADAWWAFLDEREDAAAAPALAV